MRYCTKLTSCIISPETQTPWRQEWWVAVWVGSAPSPDSQTHECVLPGKGFHSKAGLRLVTACQPFPDEDESSTMFLILMSCSCVCYCHASFSHVCSSYKCHLSYAKPEIIFMHAESKNGFIIVRKSCKHGTQYGWKHTLMWWGVRQDGDGGWHAASDILCHQWKTNLYKMNFKAIL